MKSFLLAMSLVVSASFYCGVADAQWTHTYQQCTDRTAALNHRRDAITDEVDSLIDRLEAFIAEQSDQEGETDCGTLITDSNASFDYDYCDGKKSDWSGPVDSYRYNEGKSWSDENAAEFDRLGGWYDACWAHLDDMEDALDAMEDAADDFPSLYTMTVAEDSQANVRDWIDNNL